MKKPKPLSELILLSLTLLFVTTSISQSQPIIKVFGDIDEITTEHLIRNCLQHLEVDENFYLVVKFSENMPRTQPGFTSYQENAGKSSQPTLWVNIKVNLDQNIRKRVLIHELIHVKQFIKKELIATDSKDIIWHGDRYYDHQTKPKTAPWEFEAHHDGKRLAKLIQSIPDMPLLANSKE